MPGVYSNLSFQTPEHLNAIGLLPVIPDQFESDINFLMTQAMERVMFLPFAYTIDQFRWALFNGTISPTEMNYKWWELRYIEIMFIKVDQVSLITPPI